MKTLLYGSRVTVTVEVIVEYVIKHMFCDTYRLHLQVYVSFTSELIIYFIVFEKFSVCNWLHKLMCYINFKNINFLIAHIFVRILRTKSIDFFSFLSF